MLPMTTSVMRPAVQPLDRCGVAGSVTVKAMILFAGGTVQRRHGTTDAGAICGARTTDDRQSTCEWGCRPRWLGALRKVT
jgi:hypothetical protein